MRRIETILYDGEPREEEEEEEGVMEGVMEGC